MDTSVGGRIRYWRKRRGMSRVVLAERAGRSASWLEKVGRGERVCDRVRELLAIVDVLKIEVSDLNGGISPPPNGGGPREPPKGIHAVRRSLFSALADRQPPDVDRLRS
ncbi:MAG: helix-turn-helix domain-containing protein [Egibacteraceae bacterium]